MSAPVTIPRPWEYGFGYERNPACSAFLKRTQLRKTEAGRRVRAAMADQILTATINERRERWLHVCAFVRARLPD